MTQPNNNPHDQYDLPVSKKIDLLQSNFEQYYHMAMDHHTKAGTASQILLVILSALLVLIGYDNEICHNSTDIGSAILILLFGIFGTVWAATQIARYRYWEHIALAYQKQIAEIIPEFRTRRRYHSLARAYSATAYPNLRLRSKYDPKESHSRKRRTKSLGFGVCIMQISDRYLWVALHIFVAVLGIVLLTLALSNTACTP